MHRNEQFRILLDKKSDDRRRTAQFRGKKMNIEGNSMDVCRAWKLTDLVKYHGTIKCKKEESSVDWNKLRYTHTDLDSGGSLTPLSL
jgi:hypothetical protein